MGNDNTVFLIALIIVLAAIQVIAVILIALLAHRVTDLERRQKVQKRLLVRYMADDQVVDCKWDQGTSESIQPEKELPSVWGYNQQDLKESK